MTRLHPAAPCARTLRALIAIGAAVVLAVVASGCASSAPAAPTPDPFAGLADRSDQAFRQGLEAYGQGQYRDALTSFEQARLLSPTVDARITQMIERSQVALAPQATPVPPTPTEVPAAPVATSVPMSTQAPDTELGSRYFGNVSLGLVPAKDTDALPASEFFFQDQIGLHIEGLKQHLRLPFTVRVFNVDASRLLAEVHSDDPSSAQTTAAATPTVGGLALALAPANPLQFAAPTPDALAGAAAATATPAPDEFHLVRFWDTFVWYHQGGDQPGRYRVELFANGVLTNTFAYTVGSVPIPIPTPTVVVQPEPTLEPSPAVEPTAPAAPAPQPAVAASRLVAPPAAPAAPAAPKVAPTQIPTPVPTIVPTPGNAYTTPVGGVVAGLDVDPNLGRFYMVDTTGILWTTDVPPQQQPDPPQEQPTLGTPIHLGDRAPVDLVADPTSGFLYLSTHKCRPVAPGCILVVDPRPRVDGSVGGPIASISLTSAPADIRLDADLGLVYVALPDEQAIAEVSIRSQTLVRTIGHLPQITSLALDPKRHVLYAAHLGGQLTVIDVPSLQVVARMPVTSAGLASVATARGLAYAVNTVTHELAVVEPASQSVAVYPLSQEPAAVAASQVSGAVFVLSSRASVILRIDPTDGTEIGRVLLRDRSGHSAGLPSDLQALRSRLVLNVANETVYATLPEAGTLAAVTLRTFPELAYAIPSIEADQPVSASIAGLIRPGAEPLPPESAPALQAQDPAPEAPASNTDEEGL